MKKNEDDHKKIKISWPQQKRRRPQKNEKKWRRPQKKLFEKWRRPQKYFF